MKLYQRVKELLDSGTREVTVKEPWWFPGVAFMTGLLAAVAGVVAVRTAYLSNEAVYYSNLANLAEARCADSWAEYQANSIKARIIETALLTANVTQANREILKAKDEEYRGNQKELKDKAHRFESERDTNINSSNRKLKYRDSLNLAGIGVQLAIGLASVAAMTKKTKSFIASVVVTAIALLVLGGAFIHQWLYP